LGRFGPLMPFVVLVGPLVAGDLSVTGISAQAAVLATVRLPKRMKRQFRHYCEPRGASAADDEAELSPQ
jgi:hypothetical protein